MFQSMTVVSLLTALAVFTGFTAVLLVLTRWVPGRIHLGVPLPDGSRVEYPLNGFASFVISVVAFVALGAAGIIDPTYPVRRFGELFIAANIFSAVLSAVLYARGPERGKHGFIKDFWLGTELNPRWFGVDLKVFSYRPSLIGLELLNLSFAFFEYQETGRISLAMGLFQVFMGIYLALSFQFEHGMLSMFDVIEERFGFMLVWGDYAVVPFFYCIPCWTILTRAEPMSPVTAALLTVLFVLGYWIFRGANEQKTRFKADPSRTIWGRAPETVGGRLLVSGFWGIGRKLNYTGEIMVYFAFALTAGFGAPWPFLLPLWLVSLLVQRAHRDDQRCRAKYGPLWVEYCQRARFRMFPYLY